MPKLTALNAPGLVAFLLLAWIAPYASPLMAGDVVRADSQTVVDEGACRPVKSASPVTQVQSVKGGGVRFDPPLPSSEAPADSTPAPANATPAPVFDLPEPPMSGVPLITYPAPSPVVRNTFAVQPWKEVFFDNDFSYMGDPDHECLFGEKYKGIDVRTLAIGQIWLPHVECPEDVEKVAVREFQPFNCLPDPTLISFGGEIRFRQMDESNRLRPGPPARADYQLWRGRQYVDLKVADWLRVYAEGIDASIDNNPLPPQTIDVNRWDLQNLFVDLRLWEFDDDRSMWYRVGRQELLYGSQRLISPFDWANTRRNFEGIKSFTRGSDWDFDVWCTRPVNTATTGNGPLSLFADHFDSPNMNHTFSGAWFTYKAIENQLIDLYWLWDFNSKLIQPNFAGGDRHTVATRWLRNSPVIVAGDVDRTWHGEVEGGYQFGTDFGKTVSAGFLTTGTGHTWNAIPWTPNVWLYYDWASGSSNLNGRTTNTFSQQYGDVHTYLGLIDNIARQNISDLNGRFTVNPLERVSFQTQYHWFDLANAGDVLYTATGAPLGKPRTGTHVGDELDLVSTYTCSPNFKVQVGYFWFWYGQYVETNAPRRNAEQFYVQTTVSY